MNSQVGSILFFDSGVGGLTVLYQSMDRLPNESYIYYADVANVPYGNQAKAAVKKYVLDAIADMSTRHQLKAIVVACNTATSVAIKELRNQYTIPIIGMEPAVKPALLNHEQGKKILVLATEMTLKEEKLDNLISSLDGHEKIIKLPMPELVDAAEEFDFNSPKLLRQVKSKLRSINLQNISTVVLGCTHFIYYRPLLAHLLPPDVTIIDGNEGTINRLIDLVLPATQANKQTICYLSGMEVDKEFIQPYMDYMERITK